MIKATAREDKNQDGGKFPSKMLADLGVTAEAIQIRKAGVLPYMTAAGGALVVFASWYYFWH